MHHSWPGKGVIGNSKVVAKNENFAMCGELPKTESFLIANIMHLILGNLEDTKHMIYKYNP